MKDFNFYKIKGPALISFSGGRTSGYMLKKIIDAYEGQLPEDVYVVFANTGKEMPQTLDFVNDCSDKWNCKIHWLELEIAEEKPIYRTKEVTYETASRNGEPFEALIKRKKMLPNPVTRLCTAELKINVMKRFMKGKGHKEWTNIVGLRYDEPRRVAKQNKANDMQINPWDSVCPLYQSKVTVEEVSNMWNKSNFDLNLPNHNGRTLAGNCDLCYLKGTKTLTKIIKERPDLADWWIDQENKIEKSAQKFLGRKVSTASFRKDMKYIDLLNLTKLEERQQDLFDDNSLSCFCHD
jgi:3'-phosphoadenosine 5'-phosphosulfate sulfotransferase (PAPS reductase)/FAD synthetase